MKTNKMYAFFIIVGSLLLFFSACQKEKITTSGIADDFFFLRSNGQDMPIHVCGNVSSKKMIFVIHGGPGGNSLVYRDRYTKNNVESQYAMIYWDQRYAGNTQGYGGSVDASVFANDMKKIIRLVKNKYGIDQKVYLFAHSWGGFLAPYFLSQDDNQNLVQGWIQVDGAHNYVMNDSLTKQMLLQFGNNELAVNRNTEYWRGVVDWCNNNSHLGDANSSQLNKYAQEAEAKFDAVQQSEEASPTPNTSSAIANWINDKATTASKVDQQAYQISNSKNLFKIKIPTFLVWGKYDFVCPSGLINDIEVNIGNRPAVNKIILEKSGHSPMANEPVEFWNQVINWVNIH